MPQVDELPEKRVPVRIGVSGTPLVVHKERVLHPGLHDHTQQWTADLAWGQLPTHVPLQKTFYVLNTGSLGECWAAGQTLREHAQHT
jgi:hypothetical protein